jgi:hypothetical protein
MTETTPTPMPAPAPPQDYPPSSDKWAEPGEEYYVQPELRAYYAEAEPSKRDQQAFVAQGAVVKEPIPYEIHRALGGHGDHEPVITSDRRDDVMGLRQLSDAAGYPEWKHLWRLSQARIRHRDAERQRAHDDATTRTCQICGVRSARVIVDSVWLESVAGFVWSDRYRVSVCPDDCAAVLTSAVRSAHADAAASRLLPDGRTVGQLAAEIAAVIVADHTERAEAG